MYYLHVTQTQAYLLFICNCDSDRDMSILGLFRRDVLVGACA